LGRPFDDSKIGMGRLLRFVVIHGERAQDCAVVGYDRRGPASLETVAKGKIAVISPKRILGNVRHDDLASRESRSPAGTDGRSDRHAIDRLGIYLREAGRRTMAQVESVTIEKQNGTARPWRKLLDRPTHQRQNLLQGSICGDHLQDALLGSQELFVDLTLGNILDHRDRMLIGALLIQNAGDRRLGPHDGTVFLDVPILNRPVGQGSRDQSLHERLNRQAIVRICEPHHAEAAEFLRVVAGHRLECGIDLADSGPRYVAPKGNPNRSVLENSPEVLFAHPQGLLGLLAFGDVVSDRQLFRLPRDGIPKWHSVALHPPASSLEALNFELECARVPLNRTPMHTDEGLTMLRDNEVEYRTPDHLRLSARFDQFQSSWIHM
jgi:hypothetical protein